MPVLFGQRIHDYDAAIEILIREAVGWLRQSAGTNAVQIVVYQADELEAWDRGMNRCLGRSYVAAGSDAVLDGLCKEVANLSVSHREGPLASTIGPLVDGLSSGADLGIGKTCVFGRKLAELMVSGLMAAWGLKADAEEGRSEGSTS